MSGKKGFVTSKKERFAYCLFFLGQNILWGYAGYVETFLTDVGIAAATAAVILLVPKLWDAINDMIFGYLIDRTRFKNGQKFIPWIKIGVTAVGLTTIALFAIPESVSQSVKVIWFLVAYVLFDISYTILDAPAYAVTTVMTSDVQERTSIIAGGKLWAMVGGVVATVLVPMLRPKLGWFVGCVVFVVVSVIMMVPMMFSVKERHSENSTAEENPSFKEIMNYLKHNKYLMVTLVAMLLLGIASLEQKMAIYMGRICLVQENTATLVAAGAAVSVIFVSAIVPKLSKKWDKFYVLCGGLAFTVVMNIVAYFVAKLKNGLIGTVVLFSLSAVGFVEGENAVQPAGVADGVWALFCLLPAAGFAIALVILLVFYKLRSDEVQVMSKYNNGEISKEEAERSLGAKYGSAGDA